MPRRRRSVETTPDDVIDFEVGALPLPSDEVSDLKRQIQSGSDGSGNRTVESAAGASTDGSERSSTRPGGGSNPGPADDPGDSEGLSREEGDRTIHEPGEPSLLVAVLLFTAALHG